MKDGQIWDGDRLLLALHRELEAPGWAQEGRCRTWLRLVELSPESAERF